GERPGRAEGRGRGGIIREDVHRRVEGELGRIGFGRRADETNDGEIRADRGTRLVVDAVDGHTKGGISHRAGLQRESPPDSGLRTVGTKGEGADSEVRAGACYATPPAKAASISAIVVMLPAVMSARTCASIAN